MTNNKCYSDLIRLNTFEERFEYLKLPGVIGELTFGPDRYLNQLFYNTDEWKSLRDYIIIRDNACDLGIEGHDIFDKGDIRIHHMLQITKEDILERKPWILDPEFLICTHHATHRAIHYGTLEELRLREFATRTPYDTCPWRNQNGK